MKVYIYPAQNMWKILIQKVNLIFFYFLIKNPSRYSNLILITVPWPLKQFFKTFYFFGTIDHAIKHCRQNPITSLPEWSITNFSQCLILIEDLNDLNVSIFDFKLNLKASDIRKLLNY